MALVKTLASILLVFYKLNLKVIINIIDENNLLRISNIQYHINLSTSANGVNRLK